MHNAHSNAWLLVRPIYFLKTKFAVLLLFPSLVSLKGQMTGVPGASASPGGAALTGTNTHLPFLGGQETLSEDTSTELGRIDL